MKKRSKRLLSMAIAAAMSCSMITGWASGNTAEIVSVTVNDQLVEASATTNFIVTQEDTVKVKVKIKGGDPVVALADAEATFLTALTDAFGEGQTLSDVNIEYVDQQTTAVVENDTDTEAYAIFTFRPRVIAVEGSETEKTVKLLGEHTAKVGGTAVEAVQSFVYEVKNAKDNLTITAAEGADISFTQGSAAADVAYTITNVPAVTAVKLGSVALSASDYSYSSGSLTIKQSYLNTLAVGEYALVVSAQGWNDTTLDKAIVVNAVVNEDVSDNDKEAVSEGLENVVLTPSEDGTSVTLPSDKVGEYDVKYEIVNDTTDDGVSIAEGKLTLDTDVKPFAKVEVKVYAGTGETCSDTKTVYLIPEPEKVAFGNIGLMTDGNKDAFAYDATAEEGTQDTAFYEMVGSYGNKLADRVEARNIVLGKGNKADMPHFAGALDYDQDGSFNIAEYRIYKLMMDGNVDSHMFEKVNKARAEWIK